MISRNRALRITADEFPYGPEKLAKHLAVRVSAAPLTGVEGWCVRGKNTLIRLNSSSSQWRQRFTLAHELAHLVLGTDPDIASEPFRSERREERDADQLAAEFLIPDSELQTQLCGRVPVDAKTLGRIAKRANVSPVMAGCRVVGAAKELGLKNAAIIFYTAGREQWRYANGLRIDGRQTQSLLRSAWKRKPELVREQQDDDNVIVGSMIDAKSYQVLLVQLLSEREAHQKSYDEQLRALEHDLFGADPSFRASLAGSFGTVKNKCAGHTLKHAFDFFMKNYPGVKYLGVKGKKLRSEQGREYVRLYLQRWFR